MAHVNYEPFFHIMNPNKLNLLKRRKKYITIVLDCNIRSKNEKEKKSVIQNEVIRQMKLHRKTKLTKDIAVQIITYAPDRKAPSIAVWIKKFIDILYDDRILENKEDKDFLPFNNDSQIRYLCTQYKLCKTDTKTVIKIRSFSSFVADVNKTASFIDEHQDPPSFGDDYFETKKNKERYLHFMTEEQFNTYLKMDLLKSQISFGESSSFNENFIRLWFPKKQKFVQNSSTTDTKMAESLLDYRICIKLPETPKNGTKNKELKQEYKKVLKTELKKYLARFELLKQIEIPVILSVIYYPGKDRREKDLDNILYQYIMPVINEFLLSIWKENIVSESTNELNENMKIPEKFEKGFCVGYEIIKLPKKIEKEGAIYMNFNFATGKESLIDSIDRKLDNFLESERFL